MACLRANTSNALRYGSNGVTCKQHHICLSPHNVAQKQFGKWTWATVEKVCCNFFFWKLWTAGLKEIDYLCNITQMIGEWCFSWRDYKVTYSVAWSLHLLMYFVFKYIHSWPDVRGDWARVSLALLEFVCIFWCFCRLYVRLLAKLWVGRITPEWLFKSRGSVLYKTILIWCLFITLFVL